MPAQAIGLHKPHQRRKPLSRHAVSRPALDVLTLGHRGDRDQLCNAVDLELFFERSTQAFEVLGVSSIVLGTGYAIGLAVATWKRTGGARAFKTLRNAIGGAILLGLELLVAADIVKTVTSKPSLTDAAILAMIVLIRTDAARRRLLTGPDEVGGLLADQHAGGVGMAAHDRGHHRRIGHPQPVDAANPQLRIHHAGVVAAHPAGADGVVRRLRTRVDRRLEASRRPASSRRAAGRYRRARPLSAGDPAIFALIRSPDISAARSAPASSLRYRGSMTGLSYGSADRSVMLPRLCGFSRIGPITTACRW